MCRKIFQFLVGLPLFVLLVTGILLSIIFITLTSRDTYTGAFAATGMYQQFADSFRQNLATYVAGGATDTPVGGDFVSGLPDLISSQVDAELIETVVNNNLQNIFNYLNYSSPELLVYIPISRIKTIVDSFTGEYLDKLIQDAIASLPTCPTAAGLDVSNLDCIPPGVTPSQLRQQLPAEIMDSDYIFSQIAVYMPFLNSETENVPLSEVIPEMGQQFETGFNPLEQGREMYNWIKIGLVISWGVSVLLLVLYILLAGPGLVTKLKSLGTLAVLVGALATVAGVGISLGYGQLRANIPAFPAEIDSQLTMKIFEIINLIVNTLTTRVLFTGIVTMVSGLFVYVLGVILTRRNVSQN